MRKRGFLWVLALIVIFACSPTTQIQDSVAQALTQTQAAQATLFPTFTPEPTRTPYPTRTPLGGGIPPTVPYPPPGGTEILPTPTPPAVENTPGPYPPPEGTLTPTTTQIKPSNTPTSAGGYPPPVASATSGSGYPPPSVSTFTPTPTFTLSPTPTPSRTIDPLFTPSITPLTPSPTITFTPNPNFTSTLTPTPTQSRTPTRTPTPTRTIGPTPTPTITPTGTPSLPDLTTLILDTATLNAISNLWDAPPVDITDQLEDLGGEVCDVVCIGLEWTSLDTFDTLVLTAYRTADFEDAIQTAYSAQFLYLAQGFDLESIPPGTILPEHAWAASKWNQDFVIYSSQGPAVLSFFWHADSPISAQGTIALLAEYMEIQAEILRDNGYITIDPNATPLP
ncbi:MAG: hypothetical protein Fur0022_38070 [Anaerolineales bacterium]